MFKLLLLIGLTRNWPLSILVHSKLLLVWNLSLIPYSCQPLQQFIPPSMSLSSRRQFFLVLMFLPCFLLTLNCPEFPLPYCSVVYHLRAPVMKNKCCSSGLVGQSPWLHGSRWKLFVKHFYGHLLGVKQVLKAPGTVSTLPSPEYQKEGADGPRRSVRERRPNKNVLGGEWS